MQEVQQAVKRVTDIMREISTASPERSSGIAQVGIAVNSMDQTTQQNAALVEQASPSAETLAQQTAALRQALAAFRLKSLERRDLEEISMRQSL